MLANGAHVIIKNKTIFSEYLDKSFVSNLVDELENLNIQYVLEGEYHSYMKECFKEFHDFYDTVGVSKELFKVNYSLDDIGIYKIEMMCPNDETVEKCLNIVQRNEDYDYVNSIALKSFELYSKKNTKATGIIKALEYLDIDINNSYAFGDGKNDIEMLETVGCGIAMGNACDSIKTVSYTHLLIKNLLININDSNEENNEIKCKAFYLLSLNELNKDNFNFALELINEAISFLSLIHI